MIRVTTTTTQSVDYFKTLYLKSFPNRPLDSCEDLKNQIEAIKNEIIEISSRPHGSGGKAGGINKPKQITALEAIQADRMVRYGLSCQQSQQTNPVATNPIINISQPTPSVEHTAIVPQTNTEDWSEPKTEAKIAPDTTTGAILENTATAVKNILPASTDTPKEKSKKYFWIGLGLIVVVGGVFYMVKKK